MKIPASLLFGAGLAGLAPALAAQVVAERARDAASGHTYLRTAEPLTIFDAEVLARAMGGELVSITSEEEETFLLDNFGAAEGYWIGLEFPRERWASGEETGFAHWAPGKPGRGVGEAFTLLNWGEPGAWGSTSGDVSTDRYRALLEFPESVTPGPVPPLPVTRPPNHCVLLCVIQDLTQRDLESSRNATLNELWKRSAWSADAAADASGDPLASFGMVLWGVGSGRSGLQSGEPDRAERDSNENLLARLERTHPEITTAALLDDPIASGTLLNGRVDLRVSNGSPRRGGSLDAMRDALGRPAPLCVVVAWTDPSPAGAKPPSEGERQRAMGQIDKELGALLEQLRSRPTFAEERWWIALAGLEPVVDKKAKDPRASTAVPLCILAADAPPGEILGEVGLVDLVPTALLHLGLRPRSSFGLDGHALTLDRPPTHGVNLVVNGDAEAQFGWAEAPFPLLTGWRNLGGFRLGRVGPGDRGTEEERGPTGRSAFQGQGAGPARLEQAIDLRALAADLERGNVFYRASALLGARKRTPGSIECALEFLSEQGRTLERAPLAAPPEAAGRAADSRKEATARGLRVVEARGRFPRRARAVRLVLTAAGPQGVNEFLADELELVLEHE